MEQTFTDIELKAALKAAQIWWDDMGVDVPPLPPAPKAGRTARRPSTSQNSGSQAPRHSTPIAPPAAKPEAPSMGDGIEKAKSLAAAAPTLDALKQVLTEFNAGSLSDNARNMVFARGNPEAEIMVIGESPGGEEDKAGQPFIGTAGILLDKMLAAIGLNDTNAYITNVCNWRPHGNRNPDADEMALCRVFIYRHMELYAPKLVIIVGGVSLEVLTEKTGIMRARGQWQDLTINSAAVPAMPIYHPAFLLRRPELKKQAWLDLLAIKDRLSGG